MAAFSWLSGPLGESHDDVAGSLHHACVRSYIFKLNKDKVSLEKFRVRFFFCMSNFMNYASYYLLLQCLCYFSVSLCQR